MPHPIEGLFVVDEDMVKVSLVLEVLFAEDSDAEYLSCSASAFSKTCLFFCKDLLGLRLQSVLQTFSMTLLGRLMRLIVR